MLNYKLITQLKKDEDILEIQLISEDMKKKILELEMNRSKELIPVINEGIHEVFKEKILVAISKKRPDKIIAAKPKLILLTNTGKLLGEDVYDEDELEELHEDNNAYFVSDNFVLYKNIYKNDGEKEIFKISSIDLNLFTKEDLSKYANSITIAMPSSETDLYIKKSIKLFSKDEDTIILGFTPK